MKETKFKYTEIGYIPNDWEVKNIDDNCTIKARIGWQGLKSSEYLSNGNYILITGTDFCDGFINWSSCNYVSEWRFKQDKNIQIKKGDVLITKDGTIGKVAFLDNIPMQGTLNSGVFVIRPKENNKIDPTFLSLIFKSFWFDNFLDKITAGSTIVHLYQKDFVNFIFPLPPLPEQRRIVAALSDIDNLINKLGALIKKKRAIKQGAMQQLLTGKKRLKGFSEPWNYMRLSNGLKFQCGAPFQSECFNEKRIGVRLIKNRDLKSDDQIYYYNGDYSEEYIVRNGDVLIGMDGDFLPCLWQKGIALLNQRVGRIQTNIWDLKFLYYILFNPLKQKQEGTGATTVKHLAHGDVESLTVYMPNDAKEQSAIASVLTAMDEEISALEEKKAKYEQVKQGMMQQLLTGKIRLVETAIKTNAISANVHFRRSVLAAEIAERLYEEPTFGHVKMEKMLFLTERLCHIDIGSHYHRDAAGPYDNRALRSIDSQLKKQKWFDVKRTEKGNRYVPMQNRGKHKTYFDKYYSTVLPTFEKIIDTFKTQNTERCEIVATLYSAWEDLLHSNKPFTDADIVNEVLNNWHESKKRISQDRWFNAIQWMRENGFAPKV